MLPAALGICNTLVKNAFKHKGIAAHAEAVSKVPPPSRANNYGLSLLPRVQISQALILNPCGHVFTIHKRIDTLYDMSGTKETGRMRITIIGIGEVGGAFAAALAPTADLTLCDIKEDGPPAATADALGLGIERVPGPWLEGADKVLVCVPGKQSPVVAKAALPFVGPETVYVDMSTARPDDLRAWASAFDCEGKIFVDLAIMGSIQIWGAHPPVLLSGPAAKKAQPLYDKLGSDTNIVDDGQPGDATSLKLLRSILVKGIECLAVEAMTAAEHMNVRPQLVGIMKDMDDSSIADFLEMLVTTHIPHSARRRHEIIESADQLREMGFDALVTSALPPRYEATLARKKDDKPKEGVQPMAESLAWLMGAVRR